MLLEAFKQIHGIVSIRWMSSKKTGRRVSMNTMLPIVCTKNEAFDLKKTLYINECTTTDGSTIWVVSNQDGWNDLGEES
jgi:hypothetical protein